MTLGNVEQARKKGVWAAHENITPLCPYSIILAPYHYKAWYCGLINERLYIKKNRPLKAS